MVDHSVRMPHQSHKDEKGKPQPSEDEYYTNQAENAGNTSGKANTEGQRAAQQQGGKGTVDQRGGNPQRPGEVPDTTPRATAREEGDLRQTRVYEEPRGD